MFWLGIVLSIVLLVAMMVKRHESPTNYILLFLWVLESKILTLTRTKQSLTGIMFYFRPASNLIWLVSQVNLAWYFT